MQFKSILTLLCAVMLLCLQGCAIGLRNEPLPEVNRLDLNSGTQGTRKVQIKLQAGTPQAKLRERIEKTKTNLETLISNAGLATIVQTAAEADVVIDANYYYDPAGAGPFISLISFGLIPATHTNDFRIEAKVWRGTQSKAYDLHDGYTNVMWWPLIIAAPFKPAFTDDPIIDNLLRNFVQRLKADGTFN
ncbi:MAG: hypothetical protein QM776_07950 [Rhodocyclaceae bacterium]